MSLRIHAIVLALNEEGFITHTLRALYPFVTGISVLTQYDRDWYGTPVEPDGTLTAVAGFPDPVGKIHLVMRRAPDEAAARNLEMAALCSQPHRGTLSHGRKWTEIEAFHRPPDYFWIVDADEIYDPVTIPSIVRHLEARRPRGLRIWGVNYLGTWNQPVPREAVPFCHFGFVRPGVRFEQRRTASWNESRLNAAGARLNLTEIGSRLYGFEQCPFEVGHFHHGCWLGDRARLAQKLSKSSHQETNSLEFAEHVSRLPTSHVPTALLPAVLAASDWRRDFVERDLPLA